MRNSVHFDTEDDSLLHQQPGLDSSDEEHSEKFNNINDMEDPSESFHEIIKQGFVDDVEEIKLDNFHSSTSGTAEAYPGLSNQDRYNFILLIVLYLLQGIPVGLAFGSIPFLLKSRLSYSQLGIFSFATYPYSLKLLWSPIIDTIYWKKIGRRKSWIIPIQLLSGATQDVAVDGWALTLLSKNNLSYASTAQTIGLNTGYFLSFTVFLAFNSADFRSEPSDQGILELGKYLTFWSFIYLGVTIWLLVAKSEEDSSHNGDHNMEIKTVYKTIWKICKMPRKNIELFLPLKIKRFIANETVTGLKLLEFGFSKEDLALAVLIDFPVQIVVGYFAARLSTGAQPLKPWIYAFYGRLFFALVGIFVVYSFPSNKENSRDMSYCILIKFNVDTDNNDGFIRISTVQFVSISAFMALIADPVIGGTYMTLLATFSNFGGTWPRFFVLEAVDYFTIATCRHNQENSSEIPNDPFSCVTELEKSLCNERGGTCVVERDGYYIASVACIVIGTIFFMFILPQIKKLQSMPPKVWKLRMDR
ncbi:1317_t:CDS:10 [Diversispora eburnea]|uniref:1317_t:CDS:1 n=1 Tax=Diversispora eburnea TaxID=1213867 RepID=A0A9N8V6W0_9GLOM|nr:1317_t:CDS:10 [Diversispora eburnea]